MQIFLETDRLVLRRFTEADVDHLVDLDSDPDVMHFINGGRPTPREEIQNDILPAYLDYHQRFAGYGFWAAIEKSTRTLLKMPGPVRTVPLYVKCEVAAAVSIYSRFIGMWGP